MSRLIDADALLNILERERKEHDEYGLSQRADGITDAIMDIIDAPTIEPQRMRGKWIQQTNPQKECYGYYECNICGTASYERDNYCAFCGADMRGEEK